MAKGGRKQHHQQTPRPRNVLSSKNPDLKRVTSCPHYVFIVCITACISSHFVHQVCGKSKGAPKVWIPNYPSLVKIRKVRNLFCLLLLWTSQTAGDSNQEQTKKCHVFRKHRERNGGHGGADGGGGCDEEAGTDQGRHATEWKGYFSFRLDWMFLKLTVSPAIWKSTVGSQRKNMGYERRRGDCTEACCQGKLR